MFRSRFRVEHFIICLEMVIKLFWDQSTYSGKLFIHVFCTTVVRETLLHLTFSLNLHSRKFLFYSKFSCTSFVWRTFQNVIIGFSLSFALCRAAYIFVCFTLFHVCPSVYMSVCPTLVTPYYQSYHRRLMCSSKTVVESRNNPNLFISLHFFSSWILCDNWKLPDSWYFSSTFKNQADFLHKTLQFLKSTRTCT